MYPIQGWVQGRDPRNAEIECISVDWKFDGGDRVKLEIVIGAVMGIILL